MARGPSRPCPERSEGPRGPELQRPEALRPRVLNEVKDLVGWSSSAEQELNGPRPFAHAQGTEGKELLRGAGAQRPEALRIRSGYGGKGAPPRSRSPTARGPSLTLRVRRERTLTARASITSVAQARRLRPQAPGLPHSPRPKHCRLGGARAQDAPGTSARSPWCRATRYKLP